MKQKLLSSFSQKGAKSPPTVAIYDIQSKQQ